MATGYASVIKKVILGTSLSGVDISDDVSYIVYTESTKKHSHAEFVITGDNAAVIADMPELETGRAIIFSYGYIQGVMSPYHLTVITDVSIDYTTSGLTLTIRALDKGLSLRKVGSSRIWKNITTAGIVSEIAAMHGLTPNFQQIGTPLTWGSLPQQGMDNMQFLKWLAKRETGGDYVVYIQDDVLNFITRPKGTSAIEQVAVGKDNRTMRFTVRHKESQPDPNMSGVSKVKGGKAFSANSLEQLSATGLQQWRITARNGLPYVVDRNGNTVAAVPKQVVQVGDNTYAEISTDATGKLVYSNPAKTPPDAKVLVKSDSTVGAFIDNFFPGKQTPAISPDMSDDEVLNTINSDYKTSVEDVLKATYVEVGNPVRTINQVITFSNIIKRYAGNWITTEVVHNIGSADYTTTSTLSKDGLQGSGLVQNDKVNDTPAEATTTPDSPTVQIVSQTGAVTTTEGKPVIKKPTVITTTDVRKTGRYSK
ncbi:MAG: hypothetical protein H6550_15930 [Chitinophagales bacterium]|nr:hypothetical protein [Chitinophagales bacterium]